jgi:hypothetical protein
MIYLKTIFSAYNEIKHIILNLEESYKHIDKMIICEFNKSHTGESKEFIFNNYYENIPIHLRDKIIYKPYDISSYINKFNEFSKNLRWNENLMRGYFAKDFNLTKYDIVISLDADEIIYGELYPDLLNRIGIFTPSIQLDLNQFFYKPNYYWEHKKFIAPVICKGNYYKNFPAQWRYNGKIYNKKAGVHFSWFLTIEEMIHKLNTYAHADSYGKFSNPETLTDAILNKKYPFDPNVDFQIKELDIFGNDRILFPKTFFNHFNLYSHLL